MTLLGIGLLFSRRYQFRNRERIVSRITFRFVFRPLRPIFVLFARFKLDRSFTNQRITLNE